MNRVLIIIGSLALFATVAVVAWPRPAASPPSDPAHMSSMQPIPKQAPDTGEVLPQNAHEEHVHTATGSTTAPVVPETLPEAVSSSTDFAAACGRSASVTVLATASEVRQLILPIAAHGDAELLFRSTLGGVEQARHLHARWRVTEGGIHFALGAQHIVLALDQGRWTTPTPNVEVVTLNGLMDLARMVHALQQALPESRSLASGEQLTFAGEALTIWSVTDGTVTLVAPSDGGGVPITYPLAPGAWNDLQLAVDGHGRIQRAERLVASPSTAQDPGFLVRRTPGQARRGRSPRRPLTGLAEDFDKSLVL